MVSLVMTGTEMEFVSVFVGLELGVIGPISFRKRTLQLVMILSLLESYNRYVLKLVE